MRFNPYVSAVTFFASPNTDTDVDTKTAIKWIFLTIKQYLISISPLTVKKSCLNFIPLKS